MKKLLFILSAILVSGITYGASLNPYAYNLSSTWNEETQELTVRFTLNAHPNMNGDNGNSKGIQIYAVDPANPNDRYYIYGVSGTEITNHINANNYNYECVIPIDGMSKDGTVANRRPLPTGKALTWAVQVCGLNNKNQSDPVVVTDNISRRPYSPHGIAVDNNPNSPRFGHIFVTECTDGVSGDATWNWLSSAQGRAILEYDQRLGYIKSYRKHKEGDPTTELFSLRNGNNLLEPHRVVVSDDSRIFVSSYNQNSTTSQIAAWELNTETGKHTPIIMHNPNYGNRVVGMAVKGSGTGLRLLLCYWNLSTYVLKGYEYAWNGTSFNSGTLKFTYTPEDRLKLGMTTCHTKQYFCFSDGFINVAYGAKDNSTIWLGIDLFLNTQYKAYNTRLVHFNSSGTILEDDTDLVSYGNTPDEYWYYGGGGFVPYVDKNTKTERIAMGRAYIGNGYHGRFCVFDINASGQIASVPYKLKDGINTGAVINDFAIDCAHNLYAVSFTTGTTAANNVSNGKTGSGTGRLIAIALPYDGYTTTVAPKGAAGTTFTLKPVPNILATDLTYAPYGNENKYEFSFNVNTKPELAQIRFYANEADMLANNENYSFYYEFSEAERKQGRMSVIFDAVGGTIGDDKLLNDPNENGLRNLPRGEYYWNVYVKTRESNVFAPIYTQSAVGASDFHRQHATVDNNPDNKGFGHIYVADHHNIAESNNRVHYVRAYTIGNATGNAQQDNQSNINDNTRYTTCWQVRNTTAKYMRRPAVAPDGMIYITDEGANNGNVGNDITYGFVGAGMWVLDPNNQTNGGAAVWNTPNFSTKTPNQEVTTAASFLKKGEKWYLYKTNTYEEVTHHGPNGTNDLTTNAKWQANGYRIYTLNMAANEALIHSGYDDAQSDAKPFGGGVDAYKCGDTGGQFSILATENGVWMCQHREGKVVADDSQENPDGKNGVALSFFNHSGTRTFTSTAQSALTQKTNSPLQSTPGAGMAYQKRDGAEYLYLVNHAGNILEFEIIGGASPTLNHTQTYVTGNGTKGVKYGAISSMNFDYAGNLVVTIGATYGVNGTDVNGNAVVRDHQELVIYTMPYPNQENARAIPASEVFRKLPERVAHLDMGAAELDLIIQGHGGHGCAIDLYRPLQGGEFNTICLPFTLDLTALPEGHPLKDATLKQYTGLNLNTVGGEKVLELVFTDVEPKIIAANQPYIIQPENDNGIPHIISFDGPLELTSTTGDAITWSDTEDDKTYSITHQGIIPFQYVEPQKDQNTGEILTLMLVADNRLAAMISAGNMLGFRGYFQLNQPLPKGMQTRITTSKGTATNTTIVVDGKKVNVEKFLQEGRVYIRVGEDLYNIDGQKVE